MSVATRFQAGNRFGARGRPKGARSRLSERFLSQIADDFEIYGAAVIREVREERPVDYLRLVASLIPKELSLPGDDGEVIVSRIERVIVDHQ